MTHVRLTLIDSFGLRYDGKPARLPLSSQRLVAYLALRERSLVRSRTCTYPSARPRGLPRRSPDDRWSHDVA